LVDENEEQQRAFSLTLGELFADTGLRVIGMGPLAEPADYLEMLAKGDVAALILDQKMEDGGVRYTGTQLSTYLRGVSPKLPIVILSNYTDDRNLFEDGEGDVEYVVAKSAIVNPTSREAQIFKARLVRRLDVFADLLQERSRRFHDLLVKSLREGLTSEEQTEMGLLETERLLPQQAAELKDIEALDKAIAELRRRMYPDNFTLE
jgi:hypothetical protein